MSKRERHKKDVLALLDDFIQTGDAQGLTRYVASNSSLPGRRANLELARAFGDVVEHHAEQENERLWTLCVSMTEVSDDDAPVNDPKEFIPFCGTIGIGAIGSVSPDFTEKALASLKPLARDPRWRMREAVRIGLQKLLATRSSHTLQALESWVTEGDFLETRAAAATVAEPGVLTDAQLASSALQLHRDIVDQVVRAKERRSDNFRTLRKALGYTVSVVVCAVPEQGFRFMAQLVESQDPDLLWVVKRNLKEESADQELPQGG